MFETMNVNEFTAKLKADGSPKDWLDLDQAMKEYQTISAKLPSADRGTFAVNVLCTLYRNIEKVPSWPSAVDQKSFLTFAIECVRNTRGSDNGQQGKCLFCVYHLHKYAVKQNTQKLPPELILKISYMPFENTAENLTKEYFKTYCSLLLDRLNYIEKLKSQNMAITKLFTKLSEDIIKLIEIYETVQFTNTVLAYLITKLHAIYSTCHCKELNNLFGKIFQILTTKSDVSDFKKLTESQSMDIYVKLNDCLYVIAENSSKMNFKDCVFTNVVRCCVTMLGHCPEIFHCLQTFYLNGFCTIFNEDPDGNFTQNILNNIQISCENTIKLGYSKLLKITYPFLSQLLRFYFDYSVTNSANVWKKNFNENLQETCLKLIEFLMKNLENCDQLVKCECRIKTGLHDALRLSFLAINFISLSIQDNIDISNLLPIYTSIVLHQYTILEKLCNVGCISYEKFLRKLQTDSHNAAVLLYRNSLYENAIKLFDIYLNNEIKYFKTESDLKNISRGLYNKSVCEVDAKLHENALIDAYLSLIFVQQEGYSNDKYMCLVMDIKAKALKYQNPEDSENLDEKSSNTDKKSSNTDKKSSNTDKKSQNTDNESQNHTEKSQKTDNKSQNNTEKSQKTGQKSQNNDTKLQDPDKKSRDPDKKSQNPNKNDNRSKNDDDDSKRDYLQLMTVFEACKKSVDGIYGNLKPFFCNLQFSALLKHEYTMYTKHWPSLLPIAGVWRSLLHLTKHRVSWLKVKDSKIQETFHEIVLDTANHVELVHNAYIYGVLKEMVEDFKSSKSSPETKFVMASVLFLKAELDLQEASDKYGWKIRDVYQEDDCLSTRTLKQEHEAIASALEAVDIWREVGKCMAIVSDTPLLRSSIAHLSRSLPWLRRVHKMADALQMAHVCCNVANIVEDKLSYVRASSLIVSLACSSSAALSVIISTCKVYCTALLAHKDTMDTALGFMADLAMYYAKMGLIGVSAKLVQTCQAYILHASDTYEDVKLDISIGRLLEAQSLLCMDIESKVAGQSMLSAVNGTHRHYLGIKSSGVSLPTRRLISSTIRYLSTVAGMTACARSKAALLLRRARATALTTQVYATAVDLARLGAITANVHSVEEAKVKIDNRLKYILGIPSNDQISNQTTTSKKGLSFTPKQDIETMLENMTFKKSQLSPSLPSKIPAFQIPEFFIHDNCQCHICQNPVTLTLTCQTIGLEAYMYFRAKEFDIARNYFEGCLQCFSFAETKLKSVLRKYRERYEGYIVDIVEKILWDDLRYIQLHTRIENAFFELSQKNYKEVDEKIVSIHELLNDYKDADIYLRNEVLNLLVATAKVRKVSPKPQSTGLEMEIESLKLSPTIAPPKTPMFKPKNPPKITKNIVPDEEVPKMKRKVIKLNLEDDDEHDEKQDETSKRTSKRNLRVPKLEVQKPELEIMTPAPQTVKKKKATSVENNYDSYEFATPKPRGGRKPKIIEDADNIENVEFATPKPKKKLTKSKTLSVTDCVPESSVLENSSTVRKPAMSKTVSIDSVTEDYYSVLDKTPSVRRPAKSKTVLVADSVTENKSVLEKSTSVLDFATPKPRTKSKEEDFFTPNIETPANFFTPMSTMRTYTKKSRLGIPKPLESEFSTPSLVENPDLSAQIPEKCLQTSSSFLHVPGVTSRNVETGSVRSLREKRDLKRATSPGLLNKPEKPASIPDRPRLRKPVKLSVDSPDDK